MPTVLTHAVVGLGLGRLFTARPMPRLYWGLAAGLPMVPDLDVLAFRLGIPYEATWGHRGFTHSLLFAFLVALPTAVLTWRRLGVPLADWCGFLFLAVASHGILDAMTDGGLGVAFFWPWDDRRYFLPWRPILVSPIGAGFFSARGLETLESEVYWVWIPLAVVLAAVEVVRRVWLTTPPAAAGPPGSGVGG
jgi:inner membrane protein